MDRGKKALYNSVATAAAQIITMICGFILPRLILSRFGSSYNGITASVTQFLSVIALLRAGVGGATRASLYKSLAKKDTEQISATIRATEIFMRKVALIFLGIIAVFSVAYPYLVREEFSWAFSATLVLIISLSTFVQYFFGITYQILFQADQRQYITTGLEILGVILNTVLAAVLIHLGAGIHAVKLGSAVAFSIMPIVLNLLAKKQYHLNRKAKPDFSSIGQRWDAFFHQLAAFIHNNTDIALLTVFSNTKEISVYTVYYLVANGLKSAMNTMIIGVESAFGDIIAKGEIETLQKDVTHFETMLHVIGSLLFSAAIVLVTPFVQVYTRGITDINYHREVFGYLAIFGELLSVICCPYQAVVNAAGHYKQTKKYAFMEAIINLTVSIVMIQLYGLVGVIIGTVIAIAFRNIKFAAYASQHIIHRSMGEFWKRFCVTLLTVACVFGLAKLLPMPEMISYLNWILYALEVTVIAGLVTLLFNLVFYREDLWQLLKKLWSIVGRIVKREA